MLAAASTIEEVLRAAAGCSAVLDHKIDGSVRKSTVMDRQAAERAFFSATWQMSRNGTERL